MKVTTGGFAIRQPVTILFALCDDGTVWKQELANEFTETDSPWFQHDTEVVDTESEK